MMKLLRAAILYFCFALPTYATEPPVYSFNQEGVAMKLLPSACTDTVSAEMFAQGLPKYANRAKAIASIWRMQDGTEKPFAGCWIELSAQEVGAGAAMLILVFEDAQHFLVPKSKFTKRPST